MTMREQRWEILAFAGQKHPRIPCGQLVMRLWFESEHSMTMDRDIFLELRERGEIGRILLITRHKNTIEEL